MLVVMSIPKATESKNAPSKYMLPIPCQILLTWIEIGFDIRHVKQQDIPELDILISDFLTAPLHAAFRP